MSRQPIQILLIEDNPGDAHLIREMLIEGLGDRLELMQADRLSTGLAHLARGGIQLVLLDLSLPDCQGLDTVARTRAQAPDVSIVVLTGLDDETLALQALEIGAQDYLIKGQVDGPLLARALPYALERHQNTLRLQEHKVSIQSILNSLTSHVVVLDAQGRIVAMNEAWRLFAQENNCPDKNAYLGVNYLTVTEAAAGRDGDQIAAAALKGIRAVMEGVQSYFSLEYPCHSPEEKRWFTMRVSARSGALPGVVIVHDNITERRQAEEALRENEQRLRRFYDSGLIGVIYWNMQGQITGANDKFLEMVGYTRADLAAGRIDWVNMTPPEYRYLDEASLKELKAIGVNQKPFEKVYLRKDGTRIPILLAGAMLDEAQVNGVAFILDITERKRAEEIVREGEARYRSLFTNMLNGFAHCQMLFDDDRPQDFIYLDVNRAFEMQTGLTDVVGKKVSDVIPGIRESDPELLEIYGRVALTGMPEQFEMFVQALQAWFSISVYSPQRGQFVAVFDVITERKQAEEALRESSERLTHMLANSPTVIYALKVDGDQAIPVWVSGNIEPILGFSPEAALRPEWWPGQLHPQDRPRGLAALEHLFDDLYQQDYRFLRKDGRLVWLHDEHRLLRDAGNKPREIIGAWTDITDRKQAEQALKEYSARLEADVSQRTQELRAAQEQLIRQERLAVLGQLASSVAHELRNPLGVIANAIYFLKAVQPNADAAVLDYLGLISAEVNNANKIVMDLLDFARIKGVARETVALAALVDLVLQKHPPAANITVARECLEALPPLLVDPRQIEQVLTNLIVNACQAMLEGGVLTLRAEVEVSEPLSTGPEPSFVALQVVDTGTGISPENMKKLFEPLFTTKAKGIGLGLAVSKKLIEANEGKIEVMSEPGQGSTFTVFLPAAGRVND